MNQAFEDLKQDIQNLIDTAGDTVKELVDEFARRAQSSQSTPSTGFPVPGMSTGGASEPTTDAGSEFTSQIEELRTKVRTAIDNLKQQAKAAMENPSMSSGPTSSTGGTSSGSVPADTAPGVFEPTPASGSGSDDLPQPGPGLNESAVDSKNVDDQMPAGGSDQSPNTTPVPPAPEFGTDNQPAQSGSTIGPDSFKSGA